MTKYRPRYQWYKHCEVLSDVLQRVADGELSRVMIFLPPRHSKSETASRLFPAYYLYRHPERFVGLCSYAADLAYTLSRSARENFREGGGVLRSDADAVKYWLTREGGGLWAAGVGGPITGLGFHLGIIDDPLKNSEQAASELIRAKQQDWYSTTFYTRPEPDAAVVVIQTRWHEDDLSGWLLAREADENPERWHVVNLPAIAEAPQPERFPLTVTIEPEWREDGEALCPERYTAKKLQAIESRIGSYHFGALYQQRPVAREGSFFKTAMMPPIDAAPAGLRKVRAWDSAASNRGDYTAGILMGADTAGRYYVLDVVRGRWTTDERNAVVKHTAAADGRTVRIRGPQDPGSAGVDAALAFTRLLAGYAVKTERVTGSKESRAEPFAAQLNAGNVSIVKGPWNRLYLDELRSFPMGANDDQVDASADAFGELVTGGGEVRARTAGSDSTGMRW